MQTRIFYKVLREYPTRVIVMCEARRSISFKFWILYERQLAEDTLQILKTIYERKSAEDTPKCWTACLRLLEIAIKCDSRKYNAWRGKFDMYKTSVL